MAGPDAMARHLVCCEMTAEFLTFSQSVGNDLSTPNPEYGFPGLQPGDRWCVHILRWKEALEHDAAPKVSVLSTSEHALSFVSLEDLKRHAFDLA